jgi:hypothetical protein
MGSADHYAVLKLNLISRNLILKHNSGASYVEIEVKCKRNVPEVISSSRFLRSAS